MYLETENLILRSFIDDDVKPMYQLLHDYETCRLLGILPTLDTYEQTKKRLDLWKKEDRLAICLKENKQLIGYIAINPDSEDDRVDTKELGFALIKEYRHKGYMKEAIKRVLKYLKTQHIKYVWACCFKENNDSKYLIEALGFKFVQEGFFKPETGPVYVSLEYLYEL